jgi:tellurite resistance protein TerC
METIGSPGLWAGFAAFVALALLVDFRLMRSSGPHAVSPREALRWSAAWIGLALAFNAGLWWYLRGTMPGEDADRVALEFLTGYLVEKSLAVDNIFVFLMLFTYFQVPAASQQRVLAWGVMGAIVLRAVLIFVGAALLQRFHWLLYVFGAFLLFTGLKMLWAAGQQPDLERNPVLRWITAHLPLTRGYHGEALWIGERGRRRYTPLFVVLVMIGVTDVIFAVDSIPAIFAITTDPFIVLTSNVFAVLGLRALYFLLADMAGRFHLLSYGLAAVLVFIGGKMLLVDWVKIPVFVSLGVVALLIAGAMVASLLRPAATPLPAPGPDPDA